MEITALNLIPFLKHYRILKDNCIVSINVVFPAKNKNQKNISVYPAGSRSLKHSTSFKKQVATHLEKVSKESLTIKASDFTDSPIIAAGMLGSLNEQLQKNATWRKKVNKTLFLIYKEDLPSNFVSH